MNDLIELLEGGDLRSDGHADEVAEDVIRDPELLSLLLDGLNEDDDVVRGRTAHALEKVSRTNPEFFDGVLHQLIEQTLDDKLAMVKWHLAMLFANLDLNSEATDEVISTLYTLLDDKSAMVIVWSISSLTILAQSNPDKIGEITTMLKALEEHNSAAVRNRVSKAVKIIEDGVAIPKSWLKC